MTEVAAGPQRPRRRWSDLVVTLVLGIVVVSAALLPAVTASSGETITVRGDVTLDGEPLQFFPVGFWTTGEEGVVTSSTTDANGRFTLDVPATLDGFAYAGTTPDSTRAILGFDGREVVRGVIGSLNPSGTAPVLYQGRPTATGRGLAGGTGEVHFRLTQAGRLSGTSPVKASGLQALQIRRADNSVVQTLRLDSRGRFGSTALVPGEYAVVLVPRSPGLPTVVDAQVEGGRTTTVRPVTPTRGATISGIVRAGSRAVGAVPVLLQQDGEVIAKTTSSDTGAWSFPGVAPGDFTVEVGRYDEPASRSASAVEVPIPGASPTPSPTAITPTPTPSPTSTDPETAAIQPVERTTDAVLPSSFPVTVPEGVGDVGVVTGVEEAGRITGTVSRADAADGTEDAPVRVVVEEAATGRIVRAADAGTDGRYAVGGLQPGTRYRVWAVTEPDDLTLARMGAATVSARTTGAVADVVVDTPAVTVSGTVADATDGRVAAGDPALFQRTATIDESGAYALQGLVPGAYPVVVTTSGREASDPVGVVARTDGPVVDLQAGPRPSTFKGWFISSGAGVPAITGTATDEDGDVVRFGPQTDKGEVRIGKLRAGTYTYDAESFRGSAPAVDGPWYFLPPVGSFSLSDGAITDVGPIVLLTRTH